MARQRLSWMIIVGKRKQPRKQPRFGSTKLGDEKAFPGKSMVINAGVASLPELLARTARRFDLAILPQTEQEGGGSKDMIEAALLGSGRPILIVPYLQEGGIRFDLILVCWDGSHNAARAIAELDAIPRTRQAGRSGNRRNWGAR